MKTGIKFLQIGALSAFVLIGTGQFANAVEERDFYRLNPYSEAYLACEEMADEVAPIGFTTEHEDWKTVFRNCVKATLEIEPAAGTATGELPVEDDTSYEEAEETNELMIEDVERDNLITDDYGDYQREMLQDDSTTN